MTIRQTLPQAAPGEERLESGYSGSDQPSDFRIAPVGIEDVDRAIQHLFTKELPFLTHKAVQGQNISVNWKKPHVHWAGTERFAFAKQLRPGQDRKIGRAHV